MILIVSSSIHSPVTGSTYSQPSWRSYGQLMSSWLKFLPRKYKKAEFLRAVYLIVPVSDITLSLTIHRIIPCPGLLLILSWVIIYFCTICSPVGIWCEKQPLPVDVVWVGVVKETSLIIETAETVLVMNRGEAFTLNEDCCAHIFWTVNTPEIMKRVLFIM